MRQSSQVRHNAKKRTDKGKGEGGPRDASVSVRHSHCPMDRYGLLNESSKRNKHHQPTHGSITLAIAVPCETSDRQPLPYRRETRESAPCSGAGLEPAPVRILDALLSPSSSAKKTGGGGGERYRPLPRALFEPPPPYSVSSRSCSFSSGGGSIRLRQKVWLGRDWDTRR